MNFQKPDSSLHYTKLRAIIEDLSSGGSKFKPGITRNITYLIPQKYAACFQETLCPGIAHIRLRLYFVSSFSFCHSPQSARMQQYQLLLNEFVGYLL